MIINENGLCRILAASYKYGYEIIPQPVLKYTVLFGSTWAVRLPSDAIPRKVLGLMAQHAGCIPTDAIRVHKDQPNQGIIPEVTLERIRLLEEHTGRAEYAERIPLIYKEAWQLYQTADGEIEGLHRTC